jgi:hypothetical protein
MVEQPRRAKITEPVTKDAVTDLQEEFARLRRKVDFLWEMVMFLEKYPNYKVGDYMLERNAEALALTKDGVVL